MLHQGTVHFYEDEPTKKTADKNAPPKKLFARLVAGLEFPESWMRSPTCSHQHPFRSVRNKVVLERNISFFKKNSSL